MLSCREATKSEKFSARLSKYEQLSASRRSLLSLAIQFSHILAAGLGIFSTRRYKALNLYSISSKPFWPWQRLHFTTASRNFADFFHLFAKTHTSSPSYSITAPLKVTLTFKVRCQLYKVSLCDEDSSVVFVKRVKIFNVLLNISNIFLGILLSLEFLYVGDNEILQDCQHSFIFFPIRM